MTTLNMRYHLFTFIFSFLLGATFCVVNVKVGVLLMTEAPEPFDLRRVAPALDIVFEMSEQKYGIKFDVVYHNYTGFCPKEVTVGHMSELFHVYGVNAVIGPACSGSLVAAGRLAQYFELPVVSGVGDLIIRNADDKDMYNTFTRLSYNLGKLSNTVVEVMRRYSWRHVAILYDLEYVFFNLAGSNLALDMKGIRSLPRPVDIPFTSSKLVDPGQLLREASLQARFFIIFCHADKLREFLYRADELGMTSGDYVFLTMELFPSDWLGYYTRFTRGDYMDAAVTKAYRSLLLLTLRQPDNVEYLEFSEKVKLRAKNFYGYEFGPEEAVNYFITSFYDGAIYLAEAFSLVLADGGNITDGLQVAQRLWNNTFEGITGTVAIDELGDRIADFDIFYMQNAETKLFERVGRYVGATNEYSVTNVAINWLNGLPRDVPVCGFRGELCTEKSLTEVTLSVSLSLAVFIVICAIVGGLVYRKIKNDHEREKKTWLVPWNEVQITKSEAVGSFLSKSRLSVYADCKDSCDTASKQQLFTKVGLCRGNVVAVRKLKTKVVEQTKESLMELKELQSMQHPNLARFLGIVIELGNNCLLMEYCPRGSLQDIIENDDINLDWTFRYSIIWDILKGLEYIHNSPIRYHSRLSSTNCVIDSRFMLKLTDYGIPTIYRKDQEEMLKDRATFNFGKLLWTSPEVLRCIGKPKSFTSLAKQRSDIYSLGITLHEIIMRGAPFEGCDLSASEIIDKVKAASGSDGEFRPDIPLSACSKDLRVLVQTCWSEYPEERPTIYAISNSFKKINKGQSGNILDNLMKRMEQYANNLETLVTERTKAYIEEKKRAEELLYRLLPLFVAKQLECGNSVAPETFDCVTVYFSDIVGFTNLAARSTPLQVVELLNNLYTCFDTIINNFDVYKVETIGDAYMVVSGLPVRNGDAHAKEIANMSLRVLKAVSNFNIKHLPQERLRIRIGLHSGPVVAGVVGIAMPRYCLFGDTVNTASRMESTSEPLRIQISPSTYEILEKFDTYTMECRGEVSIKGKGCMVTHWLNGVLDMST